MRLRPAARRVAPLGALALVAALTAVAGPAARADDRGGRPGAPPPRAEMLTLPADTVYQLSPELAAMLGRDTIDAAGVRALAVAARPGVPGQPTPPVGTTSLWPAIDSTKAGVTAIYLKQYTLRGVGEHIEVWVASGSDSVSAGTAFPAGDCRNDVPHSTDVTDGQVKGLIDEFDRNMYPKETKAFSTPEDRPGLLTVPGLGAAGLDFAGDGDNTVTLIDNVRDLNFYEFPENRSYTAGFFAPIFNALTDRNVMTIDAFDWRHRTGANPPNEPDDDLCKSRPARPRAYESVFAHEWQHLLQSYTDSTESVWVNEGLSMFAQSLTRYANTTRNVTQPGAAADLYCFTGFGLVKGPTNPNPNACGGPQNSLTSWGDEGTGSEIIADYGNAWSFLLFAYDRYGLGFISGLHRDGTKQGLAGVQAQLDKLGGSKRVLAADLLHDYQLATLLDRIVGAEGGTVTGIARDRVTTASLDSTVKLDNPTAYSKPGVAPNGADFVDLKVAGKALRSVTFAGDRTVLPNPDSQEQPGAVTNWFVSLVGIDAAGHRALVKSVDNAFDVRFSAAQLKAFAGYPVVVAVISHDNPDDLDPATEAYAGYRLTVNGKAAGS